MSINQITIQQSFEDFDRQNPDVYRILVELALQWYRKHGRRRISVKTFFEVMRWEMSMRTKDAHSDFKLNNNYTSRYVRKLMTDYPKLEPLFETRMLRSA